MQPPEYDPDDDRPMTDEEMTSMLAVPEAEWLRRPDQHCPANDPAKADLREMFLEMRAGQVEWARKLEVLDERILQTAADSADAKLALYKTVKRIHLQRQAANPFDPTLPEL